MARPKQSFEESVVYSDLRYWGYYKGRQCAADGYPPQNTIATILGAGGSRGGIAGHRVLVLDMTPRAWEINARVFSLPTDYVAVLVGRFCLPVHLDGPKAGQPYEASEIASALRIDVRVYWDRLRDAKDSYRRILFGSPLAVFATA